MNAFAECIPCLLKVALTTARATGCDEAGRMNAVRIALNVLERTNLNQPPPMIAAEFLAKINKALGTLDPFLEIKRESNQVAMRICDEFAKDFFMNADNDSDRLLRAVRVSIAGNIIDFAIPGGAGWEDKIIDLIHTQFDILELAELEKALEVSNSVLFLADNAGEIVFDRYLLQEVSGRVKNIKVAVKAGPALNDALLEDAKTAGLDNIPGVEIITTGAAKMGVDLESSSHEFLETFSGAELIIAKGQANFECLAEQDKNIFFLTLIKCRALAEPLNIKEGRAVLVRGRRSEKEYSRLALG
jgi:uncharacterized protein with ATP-grasp and redox domains